MNWAWMAWEWIFISPSLNQFKKKTIAHENKRLSVYLHEI